MAGKHAIARRFGHYVVRMALPLSRVSRCAPKARRASGVRLLSTQSRGLAARPVCTTRQSVVPACTASRGGQARSFVDALFATPAGSRRRSEALEHFHDERRLLRHPVALVYQVVADVNQYKHFVPWCVDSVVHDGRVNLWQSRPFSFQATLDVGFRLIGERYTSVVSVVPLQRVKTRAVNTHLFDYLTNLWSFEPGPTPDTCWLTFNISFKFKNGLYAQVANVFFDEVVDKMALAFARQCNVLKQQGWTDPAVGVGATAATPMARKAEADARPPSRHSANPSASVVVVAGDSSSPARERIATTKPRRRWRTRAREHGDGTHPSSKRRLWPPQIPSGPSLW